MPRRRTWQRGMGWGRGAIDGSGRAVRGSGQSVGASGWARERGEGGRGQASVKCSACAVAAVLTTGATRAATTTAATTTAATTASRRWSEEAEVQASVQCSSGGRCVASAHPARHGQGGAPQGSGRGWWREAGGSAGGAAFIRCAAGRAAPRRAAARGCCGAASRAARPLLLPCGHAYQGWRVHRSRRRNQSARTRRQHRTLEHGRALARRTHTYKLVSL